jgi:hypothetical protein
MTIDGVSNQAHGSLRRRMRLAAWLVSAGLAIEAATLLWSHPTAFIVFLAPGALLVAAGVLLYLWALASRTGSYDEATHEPVRPASPPGTRRTGA